MRRKNHMAPARIILIGFALLILAGALLLTLPISTRDGQGAAFFDALFTATSATCVTGLVVQDTALYWSGFGQAVILMLIQIGGMGVVTAAAAISMLAGRRIGLKERWVMQESISAPQVGGIVRRTRFILAASMINFLYNRFIHIFVFFNMINFYNINNFGNRYHLVYYNIFYSFIHYN